MSAVLLRGTFLLLMANWGYRIGAACVRVVPDARPAAVAWLLVGLFALSVTWGAMGRGPGMRGPQSALTSPLLDALPLTEASRVFIGLFERVMLYALVGAALFAAAPELRVDVVLLGLLLPTAGLVVGDSLLRSMRTVVSPLRMARVAVVPVVLQFRVVHGGGRAPVLAKLPFAARAVRYLLPTSAALIEGESILPLLGVMVLFGRRRRRRHSARGAHRLRPDRHRRRRRSSTRRARAISISCASSTCSASESRAGAGSRGARSSTRSQRRRPARDRALLEELRARGVGRVRALGRLRRDLLGLRGRAGARHPHGGARRERARDARPAADRAARSPPGQDARARRPALLVAAPYFLLLALPGPRRCGSRSSGEGEPPSPRSCSRRAPPLPSHSSRRASAA